MPLRKATSRSRMKTQTQIQMTTPQTSIMIARMTNQRTCPRLEVSGAAATQTA